MENTREGPEVTLDMTCKGCKYHQIQVQWTYGDDYEYHRCNELNVNLPSDVPAPNCPFIDKALSNLKESL